MMGKKAQREKQWKRYEEEDRARRSRQTMSRPLGRALLVPLLLGLSVTR